VIDFRRYEDYGLDDATETIREDITRDGLSEGWSGELETLNALREALRPEGIVYVDDMLGRWQKRVGAEQRCH